MLLAVRGGVAVDIPAARVCTRRWAGGRTPYTRRFAMPRGVEFAPWNAGDLGRVFDALGIAYERTSIAGRPSITKEFLEHHEHPMARNLRIAEARQASRDLHQGRHHQWRL